MTGRLEGKVAIVTGAGAGIGRSIALHFAGEGVKGLALCDLDEESLKETASEAEGTGVDVLAARTDISSWNEVETLVDEAAAKLGTIDVVVNNACYHQPPIPAEDTTEEIFVRALRSGILGSWFCAKAAFPHLKGSSSAIVNFTSGAGLAGSPTMVSHSATKAGIIGLTYTLAQEWGPHGIRVNAVAPAALTPSTELYFRTFAEQTGGKPEDFYPKPPLGNFGPPEGRIAPLVAFLASDEANYISGQVVCADGGIIMH